MSDRPRYTATGPGPLAGLGGASGEEDREAMWQKLELVKFDAQGLAPAIVQDAQTGQVLTLAYMNREALELTLATRETHFWSRSRRQLWHKGETSGHYQRVVEVRLDCDGDALLVAVHPQGPACHTGQPTCFHNLLDHEPDELAGMLGDGSDAV